MDTELTWHAGPEAGIKIHAQWFKESNERQHANIELQISHERGYPLYIIVNGIRLACIGPGESVVRLPTIPGRWGD